MPDRGKIYLVPTPIGNLGDITARGLETLGAVEIIACEDTRVTGRLLAHYGLKKKLISYHDFNEAKRIPQLLQILAEGKDIAVVTDAGSPGVSDPAYRVVRAAIENEILICPLPGPTALIPALTASGLPLDRFFFEGFLSNKSVARKKRLESLKNFGHTLVFYESPHRLEKMLADALEILGDRRACVAREISKIYEEFLRGSLSQLLETAGSRKIKGEIVILIEGDNPRNKVDNE